MHIVQVLSQAQVTYFSNCYHYYHQVDVLKGMYSRDIVMFNSLNCFCSFKYIIFKQLKQNT